MAEDEDASIIISAVFLIVMDKCSTYYYLGLAAELCKPFL